MKDCFNFNVVHERYNHRRKMNAQSEFTTCKKHSPSTADSEKNSPFDLECDKREVILLGSPIQPPFR